MCIQTPAYYLVIAAVIDIVMFFFYGIITLYVLPLDDDCSQTGVRSILSTMALVYVFGVYLLELLLQFWINNTQDPDPKKFYAGILFTNLHLLQTQVGG